MPREHQETLEPKDTQESLPIPDQGAEIREIPTTPTPALPSLDLIDAVLTEAAPALVSEAELARNAQLYPELHGEYSHLTTKLDHELDDIRTKYAEQQKPFNIGNIDILAQQGIITPDYAAKWKGIENAAQKLETTNIKPGEEEYVAHRIQKVIAVRDQIRAAVQDIIDQRIATIHAQEREEKNNLITAQEARIAELEQLLRDIEANPRMMARVTALAEQRRKEWEETQKNLKIVERLTPMVTYITQRHAVIWTTIQRLAGEQRGIDAFQNQHGNPNQEQLAALRQKLVHALTQPGTNLDLSELFPWWVHRKHSQPAQLYSAYTLHANDGSTHSILKRLAEKGDATAKELLATIKQEFKHNNILRVLYTDQALKAKRIDPWLQAMKGNNVYESGRHATVSATQTEQDILKAGGFTVVMQERDAAIREALLLEQTTSGKGNPIWRVQAMTGDLPGIKMGQASPLDMSAFPTWLREGDVFLPETVRKVRDDAAMAMKQQRAVEGAALRAKTQEAAAARHEAEANHQRGKKQGGGGKKKH